LEKPITKKGLVEWLKYQVQAPVLKRKKKRVFVNTALLEATKLSLLIADTYLPTFEPYDQDLPLHASLKSTPKG
jgi:hypothetical protein